MNRFFITVAALLLLTAAALAEQQMAHLSVTHREGQPSLIEIRLEPEI